MLILNGGIIPLVDKSWEDKEEEARGYGRSYGQC